MTRKFAMHGGGSIQHDFDGRMCCSSCHNTIQHCQCGSFSDGTVLGARRAAEVREWMKDYEEREMNGHLCDLTEDDMWHCGEEATMKEVKKPVKKHGKLAIKAPPKKNRKLYVKDLEAGQMFRFVGGFKPCNIYMLLESKGAWRACGDDLEYVMLKNGVIYSSPYNEKKEIELIDATLTVDE